MARLSNIFIVVCVLPVILIYGQTQLPGGGVAISKTCFGCICEAASGCNVTVGCDESVCGPFRITWSYWADSGKPTLQGSNQDNDAYSRCVNDPYCAARSVQGYMDKFAQDCNGDGVINCDDFLRIHRLGGYGCSGPLNSNYESTYKLCMKTFENV
ncbi:invertebrate-type lysozyme 3-like [Hylaeus anthracinus]|uniref:invertebrate-type lysozyme 3-like n=1 Tax=Hylaeus anthracinus TaxID=313031 RepID=UPI0023B98C96|nr:invertebrate-type lysozyme 3-like [Hylaeus anthracinus]